MSDECGALILVDTLLRTGRSAPANGSICIDRKRLQSRKELLRLADKEPAGGEPFYRSQCAGEFIGQRTDRRATRKIRTDEFCWHGEDQAGLNQRIEWSEKVRKREAELSVGKWCDRRLYSIARKINPFQEMGDLVSANAEGDLKHFCMARLLTHSRIETRTALFDLSKMKSRNVRDGLDVACILKIAIGYWNGRDIVECNGLRISRAKVGIGRAAIPDKPARIDIELREVGKPRVAR